MAAEFPTFLHTPAPDKVNNLTVVKNNLHVVDSRPSLPRQRILLLQGAGTASISMGLLRRTINQDAGYESHLLNNGINSLFDVNYGPNQLRQVPGEIKRHADESGQPIIVFGYSMGGRNGTLSVMEAGGTFDPVTEVEQLVMVESPIGDLRGLPREDEVWTTAFSGEADLVINKRYPLKWLRPINDEVHEQVKLPLLTHADPLVRTDIQKRIIAQLGKPETESKAA